MRAVPLALALLAVPLAGHAQNQVYDPEPPRGSAYIRFFNGMVEPVEIRPGFQPAARLGAGTGDRVTRYQVVENVAGRQLGVEVQLRGTRVRGAVTADADGFVTVLILPGADGAPRLVAVREEMNFNRARVRLGAYNTAPGCAAAQLRIEPGGAAVFDNIPLGEGRQRTVNPAQARVTVACGPVSSAPFALEGLEAGASFSVWAVARPEGGVQGFLTRDETVPWRP
jgi:hypothetical protein